MLWLLKNWDLVLSDFSVFHGMRRADVESLPAPELFDSALLLLFYAGAVQTRAVQAYRQEEQQPEPRAVESTRTDQVVADPTESQVRALRDAARRRKFGPKYGEHKYVSTEELVGVAGSG